jgi:hypothetical protein
LSDAIDTPAIPSPPPLPPLPSSPDWQALPRRAAAIAAVAGAITGTVLIGGGLGTAWVLLDLPLRWLGVAGMLVLGAAIGAAIGYRRQRRAWACAAT